MGKKKKVVTKPLIFVGVIAGGPNSRLMNGQIIGGKRSSNDHLEKCRLLLGLRSLCADLSYTHPA